MHVTNIMSGNVGLQKNVRQFLALADPACKYRRVKIVSFKCTIEHAAEDLSVTENMKLINGLVLM